MYNRFDDTDMEKVDSITIKVETEVRPGYYNKTNKTFNDGYTYIVDLKDAGKALLLIAARHKEFNLPCERVYPIEWKSVSAKYVWTLEKIDEEIMKRKQQRDAVEKIKTR